MATIDYTHTTNDVDFYDVTSTFVDEVTVLRVLEPTAPEAVPHRIVFVLPVKPDVTFEFGDGLNHIQELGLQNTYNLTLVAPSTPSEPWMGDNPSNVGRRYESFIIELQAYAVANFAATVDDEVWAISFSKGGVSCIHLLLRTPALFDRIAAWDPPASQIYRTGAEWDMEQAYGSEANYLANYMPNNIVETIDLSVFEGADIRFWVSGDHGVFGGFPTNHNSQILQFAQSLQNHGILFGWQTGTTRQHVWNSGWIQGALAWLASPVAWTGELILFPRPEKALLVKLLFSDTSGTTNDVTNTGLSELVTSAVLQSGMSFDTDGEVGAVLLQPGTDGLEFEEAFTTIDAVDKSFFVKIKVNGFGSIQTLISKENDAVNGYAFLISADGHLHWHVTQNVDLVDDVQALPEDEWVTAAGTWDAVSRTVEFYINGVFVSTKSDLESVFQEGVTVTEPLIVGKSRRQTIFPFNGAWSQVRIYSGKLTAADITALHNGNELPVETAHTLPNIIRRMLPRN